MPSISEHRPRKLLTVLPALAATLAMAIWWGGLTFYAVFAVPTGVEVLGGETEQGFVTQRVSNSINLLATLTLAVLVWNAAVRWRETGRRMRAVLIISWLVMAGTQVALYLIHPRLDAMLDAQTHSVINPSSFHSLHETYLTIVSVQWFAGLVHFIAVIADLRGKTS